MSMATWNTRSLKETAAVKCLVNEIAKYSIQIIALQETRWKGTGESRVGNYKFYFSGGERHMLGVAFGVHTSIQNAIMEFRPVNERICVLRIKSKFFNLSLINVHAETEEKEEGEKDAFYSTLERTYDRLPKSDLKIIMGDLNAKIGRESIYRPTIGKESLHKESNNNGLRVIDFAESRNMVVSSTCFPRKNIHKQTWTSPDGNTHNQIDHVLIDRRGARNITNVRSYRGANCESDHYLVGIRYRCRISRYSAHRTIRCKKFDTEKLKVNDIQTKYQELLKNQLRNNINHQENAVETTWTRLKSAVVESAEKIIGYEKIKKKNEWYDEQCKIIVDRRNKLRMLYIERPSRKREKDYKEARRAAKKIVRRKKREYNNAFIMRMQENFQNNETRKAYKELNFFHKGYKPPAGICKDVSGVIITGKEEVQKRWAEFFHQLLNDPSGKDHPNTDTVDGIDGEEPALEEEPPTLTEIINVVKSLKNNKAPGKDNIPAELFKYGGDELVEALHGLFQKIWETEKIPKDWEVSIICPIHKKGEIFECENYRGISLLSSAYKIFTSVLKNRMEPYAEQIIGEYQAGFRRNRSTTDQLFTVRQILRKCWEYNIDVYQFFIDFKQAYDSIDRKKLYMTMRDLGIPHKLIRLTKVTLDNTKSLVRIQGELGRQFEVKQGLKQGDGLAPMLFNIALEGVIRKLNIDVGANLLYKSKQLAGYADDINCLARSLISLKEVFVELELSAKEMGLKVNEDKSKILVQTRKRLTRVGQNVTIGDYNFENVEQFKYLGSILTTDNNEVKEVKARIKAANNAYFSILPVIRSRNVHIKTKILLYKTLIRSVVAYGSESWTITDECINILDTFERKILRRIYGPVKENDGWRIRYNHELYETYKSPKLSTHIRLMRLRWAGHVIRSDETKPIRKVIYTNPQGQRPRGRPRIRWEDSVENDADNLLHIRNWREQAKDRPVWRGKIQEAMARYGL